MMKLATGGKMGVSIPNDYYLKSEEEMRKLFSDVPEAIENAIALGKRCEPVEFNRKYILPQYSENDPSIDLRNLMEEGFQYRVSKGEIPEEKMQEYKDRMEMEYKVICDMGFPGYFLIVADFLVWCKKNKIRVGEGRGSAAGSLVCWLMRITEVDSIKYRITSYNVCYTKLLRYNGSNIGQGSEKAKQYLAENPDVYNEIKEKIIRAKSGLPPENVDEETGEIIDV